MILIQPAVRRGEATSVVIGCLLILLISSTVEAGTYRVYVQNETFIKNLERGRYKGPGGSVARTFSGNILKPFIRYKISDKMKVDLGGLLDIPFGDDDRVHKADPVLSFHYDFSPGYRFTAGTLDHIHPLLDGLFNDDLEFTDPVEQGIQLQAKKKHFRQDIWADWRERELPDRRENLAAGNYTQFKYKGFMMDLQAYYFHFGGGINNIKLVKDNYSFAFGTGYSFLPQNGESGFSIHYLKNFDQESRVLPKTEEDGFLFKLFTHVWGAEIYFLQWAFSDSDFIPSRGDPFYQADDFSEVGIEKIWWVKKNVAFRLNLRVTRVVEQIFVEHLSSLKWRLDFTPGKK